MTPGVGYQIQKFLLTIAVCFCMILSDFIKNTLRSRLIGKMIDIDFNVKMPNQQNLCNLKSIPADVLFLGGRVDDNKTKES